MTPFNKENLPKHIAVIMDGNGRWASQKNLKRLSGHEEGAKRTREIILSAKNLDIDYLTLYTFSTENWSRPKSEVKGLMEILSVGLKREIGLLNKHEVRVQTIGDISRFPKNIQNQLNKCVEKTAHYKGLTVTMALGYGGKQEIIDATKKMIREGINGRLNPEELTEKHLNNYLYSPNLPDVDLLIRTGGDYRISNFLLWQSAYAEFFFTQTLWPDFQESNFYEAITNYQKRERRFGGVPGQ